MAGLLNEHFAGFSGAVGAATTFSELVTEAAATPDPEQLLTTREVAQLLGVTRTVVNQWRRQGLLPASIRHGQDSGHFLHTLTDVRRIAAAPARTNGRSRAAIRAAIEDQDHFSLRALHSE